MEPYRCPCCGEELVEEEGIYCDACSPEVHTCTPRGAVVDEEERWA
jgi:hypothetical protein